MKVLLDGFLANLPNCVNRELIDKVMLSLMFHRDCSDVLEISVVNPFCFQNRSSNYENRFKTGLKASFINLIVNKAFEYFKPVIQFIHIFDITAHHQLCVIIIIKPRLTIYFISHVVLHPGCYRLLYESEHEDESKKARSNALLCPPSSVSSLPLKPLIFVEPAVSADA